jgi:hypothetical protein
MLVLACCLRYDEWKHLVKKSDEYMKQMQEKNRLYYQQQLDKELDDIGKRD